MITVGIVSWYSGPLIVELVNNMQETAVGDDLHFLICDNTNGSDEELYDLLEARSQIVVADPETPPVWRGRKRKSSYAHAQGLNTLFSQVETEVALFVDPDCRLLRNGWDSVCKSALRAAVAVGAPYHARKITKYHDFPSPIFIAFNSISIRQLGADWTPYRLSPLMEAKDQLRRILAIAGSRLGEFIVGDSFYRSKVAHQMRRHLGNSSKDTGWRIASAARNAQVRTSLFVPALHQDQFTAPYRGCPTVKELMDHFELFSWEGVPILTHFYGSGHRRHGNTPESIRRWKALAAEVVAL